MTRINGLAWDKQSAKILLWSIFLIGVYFLQIGFAHMLPHAILIVRLGSFNISEKLLSMKKKLFLIIEVFLRQPTLPT